MSRLCDVPPGARVRIDSVDVEHRLARRLAALGLIAGTEVTVTQALPGRMVLTARGSRVAIGRLVAQRVGVSALEAGTT